MTSREQLPTDTTTSPPGHLVSDAAGDTSGGRRHARATAAAEHFAAKLSHETDPSDVAAARAVGEKIIVIDVRSLVAWNQGHVPGALHVPVDELFARMNELPSADEDPQIVVYCWGPACNGSTKAALVLARAGYQHVREMIGGFEYWAREGLSIENAAGRRRRPVDELTAPLPPAQPAAP
jgi:rhodanese-related sulfurtransferase